jgi:hypothetical protein
MGDPAGASRSRRNAGSKPKVALASTVPAPPAVLHITPATWKAGTALHRVHLDVYVRISVIVDAGFSLIVDAEKASRRTRRGGAQALGLNVAQSSTISLKRSPERGVSRPVFG